MYKVNIIDGTIESFGINNVGQINILDKYIIYSGFYSNKGGLYKISTDGRENTNGYAYEFAESNFVAAYAEGEPSKTVKTIAKKSRWMWKTIF